MRLIILLASLLIVGVLVYRQVGTGSKVQEATVTMPSGVPRMPAKPQDVERFGKDLNKFVNDATSEQTKKIEQDSQ